MKLYIDSNIYLDYFRQSGENLASLRVLKQLLSRKRDRKLELLICDQTKQEYIKNREDVARQAREVLQKGVIFPIPPTIEEWKAAKTIKKHLRDIRRISRDLADQYNSEVEKESTESDKLIAEIFSLGVEITEDRGILERAYFRFLKGLPPRTKDSRLGDAVIWESLLEKAGDDDLTIITRDSDFIDKVKDKEIIKTYLRKEWESRSQKHVTLFTSLGEFITSFDKKIKIKKKIIEQEKAGVPDHRWFFDAPSSISSIPFYNRSLIDDPALASTFITSIPDTIRVSPYGISNGDTYYCPYCGREVNPSLSSVYRFQAGSAKKSFHCSNCGRSFEA